jgi:hypothetical protein
MDARELTVTGCGILVAVFAGGCLVAGFGVLGIDGHRATYPVTDGDAGAAAVPAYNHGITLDVPLPASPATVPYYRVVSVLQDSAENGIAPAVKAQIPSVEDAPELARKALEPYGKLPFDAILEKTGQVTMKKYNPFTGAVEKEFPQYTQVVYRQYVNGSPVINSKISVALGESGELLDYSKDWYVLEQDGYVPVISAEEAREKLKKQDLLLRPQCCVDGYNITRVQSGYYITVHSPYARDGKTADTCTPVWIFYGIKTGTGSDPFPLLVNATRG